MKKSFLFFALLFFVLAANAKQPQLTNYVNPDIIQ